MESSLLAILSLGFILGIKHAIEPDHVIAVSTIASRTKKLWRSSLAGVFWGIGHTVTLFIVGIFLILMKIEIPDKWAMSLEFLVGVMIVYLGITSIFSFKKIHVDEHGHEGEQHRHFYDTKDTEHIQSNKHRDISYIKSMIIGFVHGLAGSAAMAILTMSMVNNVLEGAIYMVVFGIGTIIGMLLCTTIIGIPFVVSTNKIVANKVLTQITGVISIVFGFYYMYNLGITEGLFKYWV